MSDPVSQTINNFLVAGKLGQNSSVLISTYPWVCSFVWGQHCGEYHICREHYATYYPGRSRVTRLVVVYINRRVPVEGGIINAYGVFEI